MPNDPSFGRQVRNAPDIQVPLGHDALSKNAITYDGKKLINGHAILAGISGSGKSYNFRQFGSVMGATPRTIVEVIDPHGDLYMPGEIEVKFSESTVFGLNPLQVSPDEDFGGVRRQSQRFIQLLARDTVIGDRQRIALMRLMRDMYKNYGFNHDDHRTWGLNYDPRKWIKEGVKKRHPTIDDLARYIFDKVNMLKFGGDQSTLKLTRDVSKLAQKVHKLRQTSDDVEAALETAITKAVEAYEKALRSIKEESAFEDALLWGSVDSVMGIYDRVETMQHAGIFRGKAPDFGSAQIRRYNIKSLSRSEMQAFADCLLESIFFEAKARGETNGVERVIMIDEANIFTERRDDHIMTIIAREGRKFGIAMIMATQQITSIPEAIISNTALKLILGVDPMFHGKTENALGMDKGSLKLIRPRQIALVQMTSKDSSGASGFRQLALNS
jgi:hypothetical protein